MHLLIPAVFHWTQAAPLYRDGAPAVSDLMIDLLISWLIDWQCVVLIATVIMQVPLIFFWHI